MCTRESKIIMNVVPSTNDFILDSDASDHICGQRHSFHSMKPKEPEELMTANGPIICNQIETWQ